MSRSFKDGLKTPFANLVKTYEVKDKEGVKHPLSYLPWARALALAERPRQDVLHWDGKPYFEAFGGLIVGVSQHVLLEDGTTYTQDTYLPVLDGASRPVPALRADARDIGDTINRCRAKSAALVSGVGLALYSGANADAVDFLVNLGVTPESDLGKVKPVTRKKEGKSEFIDWPTALAAARLTDPAFHWEILWSDHMDPKTGEIYRVPAIKACAGWMVGVKVRYKGEVHTEYLPIMGFVEINTKNGKKLLDHQSLPNPTAHDWNRAVMRCLVKAISLGSGYGLSTYANEEIENINVEPLKKSARPGETSEAPAEPPAPADDPAEVKRLAAELAAKLHETGKDVQGLMVWLGRSQSDADQALPPQDQLAALSIDELTRGLSAVSTPRGRAARTAVH